jgi:hypothetical protein
MQLLHSVGNEGKGEGDAEDNADDNLVDESSSQEAH